MTYDPLIPAQAPRSIGLAIAVGAGVAVASAFIVGLITGAANTQFAIGAVLIGYLSGLAMRKVRADPRLAIPGAIAALIGSALSSVVALTVHVVKVAQIPASFVLGHESTIVSDIPHYIGFLGFVFWALAAYAGWSAASGRRGWRGYGRMRGAPAAAGQAPPYGTAPGQAPYDVGPGPNQVQPHWGSTDAQTGDSGSGFTVPPSQAPGTETDQSPAT